MSLKLHIERLSIDPGVLRPEQVPSFQAALAAALQRLLVVPADPAPPPRDPVGRLAERSAQAIHRQMALR